MEVDRNKSTKHENCEVGFFKTFDGYMIIRKSNLQNKLAINEEDPRVCRACLSAANLRPWTKHIANVFSQFTASPDVFGDAYPQYLCSICLALIKKLYHFRNRCERSKEVLEKLKLWGRWSVDTIKKERKCRYPLNLSAIENTNYTQKLNRVYTKTLHIDIPPKRVVKTGQNKRDMIVTSGQNKRDMVVCSRNKQDVIINSGLDKQDVIVTAGPSMYDMDVATRQESDRNRFLYQHNSDMNVPSRPDADARDAVSNEHIYDMFPNYTELEERYTQHNEDILYPFDPPPNNDKVSRAKEKTGKKNTTQMKKRLLHTRKKKREKKQKEVETEKRQMERKRYIQRRKKLVCQDDSETLTASSNCDEPGTKATSNRKQVVGETSNKMNIDETAHSHAQTQRVFKSKRLNEKLKTNKRNRNDEYFYGDLRKQRRKLKSIPKGEQNIPRQRKGQITVILEIPDENFASFNDLVDETKPEVDSGLLDYLNEGNDENNDAFEDIKPDIEELLVRANETHLQESCTQPKTHNKGNLPPRNGMHKTIDNHGKGKKPISKTKKQLLYIRKRKWEKRQKEIEAEKQREMLRKSEMERTRNIKKSKKLLYRDDSDTLTASSNCDDEPDEEAPTNEETVEETPVKINTELSDHLYSKPPVLQSLLVRERHNHSDEEDRKTAIVQIPDENVFLEDSHDNGALSDYLTEDIDNQNSFEDLKPDIG